MVIQICKQERVVKYTFCFAAQPVERNRENGHKRGYCYDIDNNEVKADLVCFKKWRSQIK